MADDLSLHESTFYYHLVLVALYTKYLSIRTLIFMTAPFMHRLILASPHSALPMYYGHLEFQI